MSSTYDPNLTRGIDWVRFLVRDTDVRPNRAIFADEEIVAIIAKQTSATGIASYYYAAAEALADLHLQYMTAGKGKTSKKVASLAVVYGTGSGINVDLAVQARIKDLRVEAGRLSAKASGRSYALRGVRGIGSW